MQGRACTRVDVEPVRKLRFPVNSLLTGKSHSLTRRNHSALLITASLAFRADLAAHPGHSPPSFRIWQARLKPLRIPALLFSRPAMKLRLTLCIVSCLLSVLLGMALHREREERGKRGGGKPRIGLSLDTLKEERWQRDRDTFVARAEQLGAEVIVLSANSDDVQQIKDCNSLLSQNIDVLVIAPHNGDAMSKAVEEAHKAGVPVAAYDRLIRNCDLNLYFTFDNVKVGELQGKFLMERLFPAGLQSGGPKKRIARIYGAPTDNNARLFKQGQDTSLKPFIDHGQLEVIFDDWAEDWKPENAKKITQAALSKAAGGGLDAILASNDGTAGGAITALLEEKLAGKILVTGQDADLEACKRILRGEQTMTIYKPLKQLAEKAAEASVDIAKLKPVVATATYDNGRRLIPTVQVDIIAVHKDNLRETVIKDGFHKEAELFGGTK